MSTNLVEGRQLAPWKWFQGIPFKFAMEFKKKPGAGSWPSHRSNLFPLHLAILGIPSESFCQDILTLEYALMKWWDPKRFPEITLPESPLSGPQVLTSNVSYVSTIVWQPPQKSTLTHPVHNKPHLPAKHHIHVASWKPSQWLSTLRWAKLPLVVSLDSWNHLNDVSFMTCFFCLGKLQIFIWTASPVLQSPALPAGLSGRCRTTTRHPPRRSTRGRRACASRLVGSPKFTLPLALCMLHICSVCVYMDR